MESRPTEMGSTPRATTSSWIDECNNITYCKTCHKTLGTKDIIRLIITGDLSVTVAHMAIDKGSLKIESESSTNMCRMSPKKESLGELFFQRNDPNTWSSIQIPGDIISPFMKRLSEYLEIDVSLITRSVQHLLSSAYEVFIDFDLQALMKASKQRKEMIEDVMVEVFWRPIHLLKTERENESWFESVDCGCVLPLYTTYEKQYDYAIDNNLKCIHEIERSPKKVIRWYFLEFNGHTNQQSYSMFLQSRIRKNKLPTRNKIIFEDDDESISGNHVIHVFRYFSDTDHDSDQNCAFENQDTVNLFCNPFMQIKCTLPYIVQSYNPETSKYVFHLVYKDDVKPTLQNFYQLLTMLQHICFVMDIDSVVLKRCGSYKLRKVLNMIQYVFCDNGIAVTITDSKKNTTCCPKMLSFC